MGTTNSNLDLSYVWLNHLNRLVLFQFRWRFKDGHELNRMVHLTKLRGVKSGKYLST